MIFLTRHGQTEFNRDGRLQGRLDSPLTPLGVQQARRMGRVLSRFVGDGGDWSIMSSPLPRALQTAWIICKETGLGCAIQTDERLLELSVGAFDGLTRDEILAAFPDAAVGRGWLYAAPGGEGEEGLRSRLAAWLSERQEADGKRLLVVSHGIAGRMLRQLYAGEVAIDDGPPPQDAVFRLFAGQVEQVDCEWP